MRNIYIKFRHFIGWSFALLVPLGAYALIERPDTNLIPDTTIGTVGGIYEVICVATSWILVFGIIIGVLFIVWGGVKYITSGGESGKEEDAKGVIKTALIGVVFLILAVALVRIVVSFFGGNIDNALSLTNCSSNVSTFSAPGGGPGGGSGSCGDGFCDSANGETATTCSADCGGGGGGGGSGFCGDGTCDGAAGEDTTTCPADCGSGGGGAPPPPPPPPAP